MSGTRPPILATLLGCALAVPIALAIGVWLTVGVAGDVQAIADARGWDDVVLSPSFADTDGNGEERRAWCAYETQEECDTDDTGANAPWVIEVTP